VALRGELAGDGFDAGAVTIHFHLCTEGCEHVPSVSTIWRILKRRGSSPRSRTSDPEAHGCASRPHYQ